MGKPKKVIPHGFKQKNKKNKKTKTFIEFDENARADYLTGFQKRKEARRKKANDEKEALLLEEKRRIKEKKRMMVEERLKQFEEGTVDDGLGGMASSETFELPSHTVTVTDVTDIDYVGSSGLMLGANKAADEEGDDKDSGDSDSDESGKEEKKEEAHGTKHFRANGSIRRQWNPHKKERNHWQLASKKHKINKPKSKESYDRMKRKLKRRDKKDL